MSSDLYPKYADGDLDPEVEAFLEPMRSDPSPPLSSLSPQEVREACDIRAWIRKKDSVERIVDSSVPGAGGAIPIRVYSPSGRAPLPVVVYFHGGGWVFGDLDQADHLCLALSRRTPCVVVSVGYRLSPENKYPAALGDASAAVAWVAENIGEYGGDPRLIAVAGESAGANLATVVCRKARDRGGPRIAFQLLLCPWTDLGSTDTYSYRAFGDGPWLSRGNLEYYRAQYLQDSAQARDPDISPLRAEDLSGLPPAHIVTAEFDALRDEGEAYARRLRESGIAVTAKRYKGMIHSFIILNAVFSRADEAVDECVERLRNGFGIG